MTRIAPPTMEQEVNSPVIREDSRHGYFMKQALAMVSFIHRLHLLPIPSIWQNLPGRKGTRYWGDPSRLCPSLQWQDCGIGYEWYQSLNECMLQLLVLLASFSLYKRCQEPKKKSKSKVVMANNMLQGTRHAEFLAIAEMLQTYPKSAIKETDLYVTVEPCIMCAAALRQYGIRSVYFGTHNERFGGVGGVLTVHSEWVFTSPSIFIGTGRLIEFSLDQ